MAKMSKKSDKKGNGAMIAAEIGAGALAAAGAAAAGFYFYAGKDAAKHRRKTAKWANEMKNQVVKEAKKQAKVVAKLDKKAMDVIIDRASKAYESARNVKREDLMAAAMELKQNWKEIEAELAVAAKKSGSAAKKAVKTATKSARTATKKAPKKAAPKKVTKKSAPKKSAKKSK